MSALGRAGTFAGVLERWWEPVRPSRDELAWRSVRQPWGILVAETMLAQTPARRVNERFAPFLTAFASPEALARASPAEVLRAWSGLGYNRRALQLRTAAATIVARHGGEVPCDIDALLALAGVGPYIARAVASFAFGVDVGVLDTNVGRVLARSVTGAPLRRRAAQELADSLVPKGRSRDWNLLLMDFGSLVCRARRPGCEVCPLAASHCAWRRSGGDDPAPKSAAVSRPQARFVGSDREVRGRLVRAACAGEIGPVQVATTSGIVDDPERLERIVSELVAERMLERSVNGGLSLSHFGGRAEKVPRTGVEWHRGDTER